MNDQPTKASGSCLCGAIRFTVELPSLACAHCHCSMCRSHHGAAYATWLVVPRAQLQIDAGAELLERYLSSEHGSRSFCRRCGSSLFCDSTHRAEQIDVALAALRDPVDREPQVHIYFDSRAPWVHVDDGLPQLGGKTGFEPLEGAPEADEEAPVTDRIDTIASTFFAAIERGDVDAIREIYAPEAEIWHNVTNRSQTREENLALLKFFTGRVSERRYEVLAREFFDGGFVQRHVLHGKLESGEVVAAPVCLVVYVSDGKIVRLFEYLDPATVRAAFA